MRPGDLARIYGTCVPALEDTEVTPGWVWRDEAGVKLDVTRFNSSHLSSCGETFLVTKRV